MSQRVSPVSESTTSYGASELLFIEFTEFSQILPGFACNTTTPRCFDGQLICLTSF